MFYISKLKNKTAFTTNSNCSQLKLSLLYTIFNKQISLLLNICSFECYRDCFKSAEYEHIHTYMITVYAHYQLALHKYAHRRLNGIRRMLRRRRHPPLVDYSAGQRWRPFYAFGRRRLRPITLGEAPARRRCSFPVRPSVEARLLLR